VERSAELKRELLEFSWQPRFDRERREVLRDHLADRFVGDAEVITALDYFLLQHELRSGETVVERFVASRPELPEHERELLLGLARRCGGHIRGPRLRRRRARRREPR
jgi:hypothetical protein